MFVPQNHHLSGKEYHTITCAKYKFIYNTEIVEGKDPPRVMDKKECEEKGAEAGLMVRMTNPIWGTGKLVVMDSGFCVLEVFISMVEKGVLGSASIKKRCYWTKGVPAEEILWNMQNKEVGDVEAVQVSIIGKIYHIMSIKETDYVILMMKTYGTLEHL